MRDAVKKPVDWAIGHPQEALAGMQTGLASLDPAKAQAMATQIVGVLTLQGVPPAALADAAKNVSGAAGQALLAAVTIVTPPAAGAVADAAQQAVDQAAGAANQASDAAKKAAGNLTGNWQAPSLLKCP